MTRNQVQWVAVAALVAVVALGAGCRKSVVHPSETRNIMGTTVTIVAYDPGLTMPDVKPIFAKVFDMLSNFERMTLLPGTLNQVAALSKSAGNQSLPLDTSVFGMLMKALRFYDTSGKVFDVRYGPMLDLWQFGEKARIPTPSELDSVRTVVVDGGMFVAGNSILLAKRGMRFDPREIALGYAFDLAAAQLAQSVRNAMIYSPRVCRAMGDPPERRGFLFAIANPLHLDTAWATVWVPAGGTAYASAGVDRFESGGKAYHSLLDPRTGMPARTCAGALVQAADAATAQAMAYSVFVWGTPDSLAAKGRAAVNGSVIMHEQDGDFELSASGSLAGRIEVSR
jgi:thiamine biosynthesis lipoprotein ApbE